IIINTGPIVTETFTMNDMDEGWLWSEFFNSYKNKTSLTLTEKQETDTAINKIIKDKNDPLKIKYPNPKSALKLILLSAYHALQNKFDYTEINELKKELLFLKSFFFTSAKYTNFSNKNSNYIFFPLHIPWDAQIATRNPMFYSQEAIVEMLANACPPNINIYVKEHPYYHGNVNNEIFKTIKKHTNVKLIHPSVSSADLIKNSKAVVTINSTAGWESILFKKPLIVLGNPFYSYFKYAYKVENINTLPKLLNEAIEKGEKIYSDTDEWYKFINSAILSSHKGSFVLYKKYMGFAKDLTEKRIKLLANELSEKINELTNCQHS
ncbi:MAG: hypothetical protein KAJ48_02410, partial [Elusimicrobiales bacterium]|nr:hypothetical protein [Elusimicrobiales bacterium]